MDELQQVHTGILLSTRLLQTHGAAGTDSHARKDKYHGRKSIIKEAQDIRLAMELISLGARLQMLESETQISRGRLIRLYKELRGCPPRKVCCRFPPTGL